MKKLHLIFCLISLWSCNTVLDPINTNAMIVFKNEQIYDQWRLVAGYASLSGAKIIDDIFDASKNPQAEQVACAKNSVLDFTRRLTFEEKNDCYVGKNESGKYVFGDNKIKLTYNNSDIEGREYTIKSIEKGFMIVEYSVLINNLTITTTLTYEQQ